MTKAKNRKLDLADRIATGEMRTLGSKLKIVASLSWPAMMAQLSMILMEYIDAAMVGSLGAVPSAAIGIVATTTWLFGGFGTAAVTGYSVQVAHRVGASDDKGAKAVMRQGLVAVGAVGLLVMLIGVAISPHLPVWLGADAEVSAQAADYFRVFSYAMPAYYMMIFFGAMLRCSGNMVVPGVVNVLTCILDVLFNFLLIFPERQVEIFGVDITLPGAGLGVYGAALGTLLAMAVAGIFLWYSTMIKSRRLSHPYRSLTSIRERLGLSSNTLKRASTICWPVAMERIVMCGAQIMITAIVAPLGNAAIAANSFAVTAESLCYMPGFGIGEASTTLVGQSLGARRPDLAKSFGRISVVSGMTLMGILGVVMWILAPEMMSLFTPDEEIRSLGTMALRTEAWAEPMFGAAIVCYGVCVGAGYTLIPASINFLSIWAVRLTLSAILAPTLGLFGVWLAMCIELCVRGLCLLYVFIRGAWHRKFKFVPQAEADELVMADD